MNYNNVKFASIVSDMKNLRILYMEGNELTYVPTFHDENDVTGFRLDLRQVFDSPEHGCPDRTNPILVRFGGPDVWTDLTWSGAVVRNP